MVKASHSWSATTPSQPSAFEHLGRGRRAELLGPWFESGRVEGALDGAAGVGFGNREPARQGDQDRHRARYRLASAGDFVPHSTHIVDVNFSDLFGRPVGRVQVGGVQAQPAVTDDRAQPQFRELSIANQPCVQRYPHVCTVEVVVSETRAIIERRAAWSDVVRGEG